MNEKETDIGKEYEEGLRSLNVKALSKIGFELNRLLSTIHNFNKTNGDSKLSIERKSQLNEFHGFNKIVVSIVEDEVGYSTNDITLNIKLEGKDIESFIYNIAYLELVDIFSISSEDGGCTIDPYLEDAIEYDYSNTDICLIILSVSIILSNFKAGKVTYLDQYKRKKELEKYNTIVTF